VIQYGDTLLGISRRFGTDVNTLVALNNIWNPNWIYAGTTLCLPGTTLPGQAAVAQLALQVTYSYTPTDDENAWPMAQTKRLADLPLLWLTRRSEDQPGYLLVSVGPTEPLAALRISETQTITPIVPPPSPLSCPSEPITVLGDPGLIAEDLTMWLESADGVGYPVEITHLAHANDVSDLSRCYYGPNSEAFAMAIWGPAREGEGYRVVMVLTKQGFGPPSHTHAGSCGQWGAGGWYYGFLRAWYGCP
jgi:hypothetical protein